MCYFPVEMKRVLGIAALAISATLPFAGCSSSGGSSDTSGDADASNDARHEAAALPDGAIDGVDAGTHPLCVNGMSVDGEYPKVATSIGLGATPPNLSFDGLDETGKPITVKLSDYFEPCATQSRLLVIRESAGWCGTCRYPLSHTNDSKKAAYGARLRFLDLLVADEDNNPATQADLTAHRARIDAPDRLGADPTLSFQMPPPPTLLLPLFVLIDTKTMQVRNVLANPDPAELAYRLQQELALLDGTAEPAYPAQSLVDGQWTPDQWALLQETTVPGAPPVDATNEKADDAAAAALGKLLFNDTSLSPSNTVSCATCHDFTKGTSDGLQQSEGVQKVDRNAPSIALASFSRWQFWDGRADSLWAQATGPFEAPKEFGSSRLFVAHQIYANYKSQYEAVWTKYPLPDLTDNVRFPASGMPGVAAYDAMAQADKDAVTRILANVAKSIAAFERTIRVQPNKLDTYVGGDFTALSSDEKKGLAAFIKVGCMQCHWGPRLTDDAFHNTRFPTGRQDQAADRGRIDVVSNVLTGEFISQSAYSDAPAPHSGTSHLVANNALLGAFKTPTLRGITETAPYGHGGIELTFLDVTKLYSTAGLMPGDPKSAGVTEPWVAKFDATVPPVMVPFLQTLSANAAAP
jgi:cytochrome c peroxidase